MEQLQINGWVLEYDREATRRAYAAAGPRGPETCECVHCRNFVAARTAAYPPSLRELASALGVDPLIEAEISEYGPWNDDPKTRLYGGWFHFVGRIISDAGAPVEGVYFLDQRSLVPHSFRALPVVQVEFSFPVPWVLNEPPE